MAVSSTADAFYALFNTFTALAILVSVVVFALMVYFLVRFRSRASIPDPEDAPRLDRLQAPKGHLKTVVVSVTLSSIILGFLIFGTFSAVDRINTPPAECLSPPEGSTPLARNPCLIVQVLGFRFDWNFTYIHLPHQNTTFSPPAFEHTLTIPVNTTVVLRVTSRDVFHDFGIIDFRIKTDALPGRTNIIWFIASQVGTYAAQCFELCGPGHYVMTAKIVVLTMNDFNNCCSGL